MTVFLTALVLIVLLAAIGHRIGAIRGVVSIIGIVVGGMLAFRLAPLTTPLFAMLHSRNPVWNWVLPPLTIFLLVQAVFAVIAFLVHRKVEWHYKYKATDEMRHCWERLNSRLGMCVGVVTACAYLLLLGTIFYAAGYLTYQIAAADPKKENQKLKYLNMIRDDLHATGLDRALVAIDPTPKGFYAAADLVGLLYHNPPLQTKLGDYPALVELAERPEMQELARDPQFNEFLLTQPGALAILNHPKVNEVFGNAEVLQSLYKLSPPDLLQFVETGKSDLFGTEQILGRWIMEPSATFGAAYRRNPQMTAKDTSSLKKQLDVLTGLSLIATPGGKLILRGPSLNQQGTWKKSGGTYTAEVAGPSINVGRAGGSFEAVSVENGQLQLWAPDGFALVFNRPD